LADGPGQVADFQTGQHLPGMHMVVKLIAYSIAAPQGLVIYLSYYHINNTLQ
jgi:hypothetical protein